MIKVYADSESPRLTYVLDFVFKERGMDYALVYRTDQIAPNDEVLNYSNKAIGGFQLEPGTLLFEQDVRPQVVTEASFFDEPCIALNGKVDPLSSIFFVLCRYEEYLSHERDRHGRFCFKNSVLSKNGYVMKAVCDRWSLALIKQLGLEVKQNFRPNVIPTFDIDNAFAYQYKTGIRKYLSIARDWVKRDWQRLKLRRSVYKGKKDPYDSYDQIEVISKNFPETVLFWLSGGTTRFDRNISLSHPAIQALIDRLGKTVTIGLHPSYSTLDAPDQLKKEKQELEASTGAKIVFSRQHFLRVQFPSTYRNLLAAGIQEDFSMGFAEHVGFRSGTARAHFWYDLERNEVTSLRIRPFLYMDGTLNEYMQLEIQESRRVIDQLYEEICRFGGDFCFIWHNETITDHGKWQGWSAVLNHTLNLGYEQE